VSLGRYDRKGPAKRGANEHLLRLGERVRMLRERLDIDQAALAERCGKTQPWVSRLENGRLDLHLTSLFDLARGLRCSMVELLAW